RLLHEKHPGRYPAAGVFPGVGANSDRSIDPSRRGAGPVRRQRTKVRSCSLEGRSRRAGRRELSTAEEAAYERVPARDRAPSPAPGEVYTFGPTFRAENSNTSRHAAEFWMIEPEMAWAELDDNMDVAEDFLKYLFRYALETCTDEMDFFGQWVDKEVRSTLEGVIGSQFERLPYTQAISILEKSGEKFQYPVSWGLDLQSEHERFL